VNTQQKVASPAAETQTDDQTTTAQRKAYQAPELRELGDMRGITLGGSPGAGESGFTTLFKP